MGHNTTHNRLRPIDLLRLGTGDHADGGGLYLQIRPTKAGGMSRSWLFRFTRQGRERYMGLGPLHTIGLADARQKAREARRQLLEGVDPIDAREAERATQRVAKATTMTFKDAAAAYIDAQSAGWGPKQEEQWRQSLGTYAFPTLGALPVAAIDVGLVMRAIEPLWTTKTTTASRVRQRIEAVLGWATVHGYRQGDNPAKWANHLDKLLPAKGRVAPVEHHAALPYPEIGGFMVELRGREGVAACALQFAILTAARAGEVLGARWGEFNLAERLWTIPANRMKAGKEHRVPLSDAAMAILGEAGEPEAHVFPGRSGPLGHTTLFALLQRMGRDLTTHGFRSTFRSWAAERTNFPREAAELALAHTVGDATERAYQRGDLFQKRRGLMDAWSAFCSGDSQGKVVRLRGAR
jgi:integrase